MKRLLCLIVLVWSHSLFSQTAGGQSTPPNIKDSYDFRRFLVGSTWTWCWGSDGAKGSEIKFTTDGKVKHNAFEAKYLIRSATDVELQWNGQVAKLHFDAPTYARYTGSDFGNARPLYGAPRPAGTAASIEEVTAAAFADGPKAGVAATAPTVSQAGRQTYFGTRSAGVATPAPSGAAAIQQELNVLSAEHDAALAASNKRFQSDLVPLLKRAEQAGDAALALRIKNLLASLDASPDAAARPPTTKP